MMRKASSAGGLTWAEPEMAYQAAPSALVTSTDVKAALRGGPAKTPNVMDAGARLDMVQSRELTACIGRGLTLAFGQLLSTRVGHGALQSPHWFTCRLMPAPERAH